MLDTFLASILIISFLYNKFYAFISTLSKIDWQMADLQPIKEFGKFLAAFLAVILTTILNFAVLFLLGYNLFYMYFFSSPLFKFQY